MKKIIYLVVCFCLLLSLFIAQYADAAAIKWIRFGAYQAKVTSTGDMGEGGLGWAESGFYEYPINGDPPYSNSVWASHAGFLGTRNWTDQAGTFWGVKTTGWGQWDSDELFTWMPVSDENGIEIHQYLSYAPPTIAVDGVRMEDPFPFDAADHIAPEKTPGSSYCMVESWANTDMGITQHQKVYMWNFAEHDDYFIYDITFINTGNVDLDDEIELPSQVINDVYYLRGERIHYSDSWMTTVGEEPTDPLNMVCYSYPRTQRGSWSTGWDSFGNPRQSSGYLEYPFSSGFLLLHVDQSVSDHSHNPAQPNVSGITNCDLAPYVLPPNQRSESNWLTCMEAMESGFAQHPEWALPDYVGGYNDPGSWGAGMHKSARYDDLNRTSGGVADDLLDVNDFPFGFPTLWGMWSVGPYTMAPMDSFRVVFAIVSGALSVEKSTEVGADWLAGTATFPGPINLPLQFSQMGLTANDLAKDAWVYSAVDTLFRNATNAKNNWESGLDIPVPPAAPDIEVFSRPDAIQINWGTVDGATGYKVYRAQGSPFTDHPDNQVIGSWASIADYGAGTNSHDDASAERGQAYFYYVSAVGADGLESGRHMNVTRVAATLTRVSGTLESVRVVPNPYNFAAREVQFVGEENKIIFMDIPGVCTIKIFTETGDLVKTIEHTDGSGDHSWGILEEEHQASNTGQLVVSGIYIAHISTPDGKSKNVKFVIVR